MPWIDIGMAFSMGIIGSIHCVGMCGGILASLAIGQKKLYWPGLFFYHAGRITTYCILSLLVGVFTQYITATKQVQMGVSVITGLLIIIFALQLGGWISERFNAAFLFFIPPSLLRRVSKEGSVTAWSVTGLLNGLLPCSMVYAAVAFSVSRSDPTYSVMTMLAFGLGTIPALTVFSGLIRRIAPSLRGALLRWGAVILITFGLFTIARGFGVMPIHIL